MSPAFLVVDQLRSGALFSTRVNTEDEAREMVELAEQVDTLAASRAYQLHLDWTARDKLVAEWVR